ncbi:MAG: ATP-binding cassette domain-containing protein [Deltaproteobacteria bacterium]|nr:ATP-binding cassette domain-containing protein [Deltaproteobacteria bacterium]
MPGTGSRAPAGRGTAGPSPGRPADAESARRQDARRSRALGKFGEADCSGPLPLESEGLTVAYGDSPPLLENVDFLAWPGEILGILGPSGCGKSSLLRHLVGLNWPRTGRVRLFGEDIFAGGERSLDRARHRFGIMYQGGALFGNMNLIENVQMPLREFTSLPPAALEAAAALKLELVELAGFERYMPSEISGGMRKRAAIARAMALDPGLIFLDEPSAGLDPVTAASLDELIMTLSKNLRITFVVVTHELRSIMRAVDWAILLDKRLKGIAAEGSPRYLAEESDSPEARRFFLRAGDPGERDGPGAAALDGGPPGPAVGDGAGKAPEPDGKS